MHVVGGVKGRVRSLGHRRFINKTDLGLRYRNYNLFFPPLGGGESKKSDKCDIRSGAQGRSKGLVGRRGREKTAGRGKGKGKGWGGGGGETESGSTKV